MDHQGARPPGGGDLELPPGAGAEPSALSRHLRGGQDPLLPGLPGRLDGAIKRALRRLRRVIGRSPRLLPVIHLANPLGRTRALGPDTELVIEGYPRSGNTFARYAFLAAQDRPVVVSSHVHVPAQVLAAVRAGVPTLVIIRDPADAVVSNLVFSPHARPAQVLDEWLDFYRRVLPQRRGFVLATFDEVVADLGGVIRAVNERFGTDFVPFEPDEGEVERLFAAIESDHERTHPGDERTVPRPSPDRADDQRVASWRLADDAVADRLAEARALYLGATTPAQRRPEA